MRKRKKRRTAEKKRITNFSCHRARFLTNLLLLERARHPNLRSNEEEAGSRSRYERKERKIGAKIIRFSFPPIFRDYMHLPVPSRAEDSTKLIWLVCEERAAEIRIFFLYNFTIAHSKCCVIKCAKEGVKLIDPFCQCCVCLHLFRYRGKNYGWNPTASYEPQLQSPIYT